MPIAIEQRQQDRCLILLVRGAFDGIPDARTFRRAAETAVENGHRLILVNFHELGDESNAIDGYGLETLLACGFMAAHAGGGLQIFGAGAGVAAEIRQIGGEHLLSPAATELAAVDDLLDAANTSSFDILQFVREEEREEQQEGSSLA